MQNPLVFLTHSEAKPLLEQLEGTITGFLPDCRVWHDKQLGGGKWNPQIVEKLDNAAAVVLLATPNVLGSIFAGFELGYVDKNLGDRKVFILRAGVSVRDLQTRPPLGDFQAYNSEEKTDLLAFLKSLATETETALDRTVTAESLAAVASRFASLVKEELSTPETGRKISRPRLPDSQGAMSTISNLDVKALFKVRNDIDAIEKDLGRLETMIEVNDFSSATFWHDEISRALEARSRQGLPEGNLKSRYDRLTTRFSDLTHRLVGLV